MFKKSLHIIKSYYGDKYFKSCDILINYGNLSLKNNLIIDAIYKYSEALIILE